MAVWGIWRHLKTLSLDENNLLCEGKVSWNKHMKGVESVFFKGFGIICGCVKCMVWKWYGIIVIHRK
jgi:hypothetical protein